MNERQLSLLSLMDALKTQVRLYASHDGERRPIIYVRLKPKPLATLIKFEVVEVEDTVLHSVNTIGFTVGDLLTIFIAICFINFIIALLYLFDFAIAPQTEGF